MKKDSASPLVSVIMSVYNAELYLESAIKSILNQTYKKIEFIIVNDGSTDGSIAIIRQYMKQDSRIVLIDQENIGLTKSLNKALSVSNGQYIARQDADDESLDTRIETQLYYIRKYSFDIVTSRALKKFKAVPHSFLLNLNKKNGLKAGNLFVHGTFFGKKTTFLSIKYDEEYTYAQDFKFILDCIKFSHKIGYIAQPLYIINDIDTNISNQKKSKQDYFVSSSLVKHFGTDRYFKVINKLNGNILAKTVRFSIIIFLQFSRGKDAFYIIKN
jgi:glycosyltransferase involved in cell wall biosynthesis